jgi:membrane protease YdiL (CAAX protease family)
LLYTAIIAGFWFSVRHSPVATAMGPTFLRAFASFALLLAPLWLFGFGAAELLSPMPVWIRIGSAGFLSVPYFVFAAGTAFFQWPIAAEMIAFPILLAAFLEPANVSQKMHWRDAAALAIVVAVYYTKTFDAAWPLPHFTFFPKLFLADTALYLYLAIRRLEGIGYSLVPSRSAVVIGFREWLFYFPIALALGEATGFIHFHAARPTGMVLGAVLLTFLLIALPEELFFRGILQNLLETRVGKNLALLIAAVIFGLSHFNHGAIFNWRYVLMASIAGVFYGRAWRTNRQILTSVVTHTAVDLVWSVWFR